MNQMRLIEISMHESLSIYNRKYFFYTECFTRPVLLEKSGLGENTPMLKLFKIFSVKMLAGQRVHLEFNYQSIIWLPITAVSKMFWILVACVSVRKSYNPVASGV